MFSSLRYTSEHRLGVFSPPRRPLDKDESAVSRCFLMIIVTVVVSEFWFLQWISSTTRSTLLDFLFIGMVLKRSVMGVYWFNRKFNPLWELKRAAIVAKALRVEENQLHPNKGSWTETYLGFYGDRCTVLSILPLYIFRWRTHVVIGKRRHPGWPRRGKYQIPTGSAYSETCFGKAKQIPEKFIFNIIKRLYYYWRSIPRLLLAGNAQRPDRNQATIFASLAGVFFFFVSSLSSDSFPPNDPNDCFW